MMAEHDHHNMPLCQVSPDLLGLWRGNCKDNWYSGFRLVQSQEIQLNEELYSCSVGVDFLISVR